MNGAEITVYIRDHCNECSKLLALLEKWNTQYKLRNVTNNPTIMKELQERGVYGTPAIFIDGREPILGFQINTLKRELERM